MKNIINFYTKGGEARGFPSAVHTALSLHHSWIEYQVVARMTTFSHIHTKKLCLRAGSHRGKRVEA
jgi:hypothetical protein